MSAYMMDKADIDQIMSIALHGPADAQSWTPQLNADEVNDIGDMMIRENLSSIHARYPDSVNNPEGTPGPIEQYWLTPYAFEQPAARHDKEAAHSTVRSYRYQSCEHSEWATSKACGFVELLLVLLADCQLKPKPVPPTRKVRYYTITETAKLVRAALKQAFPDTKFSVRSESYSMGSHLRVSYTDGPPTKGVEAITGQFYGTGFDGMTDSATHHDTVHNGELSHFAGSRPSVSRSYSNEDELRPTIETMLAARWNPNMGSTWEDKQRFERASWLILSRWDRRYETIDRTVEKFFAEGCKTYHE